MGVTRPWSGRAGGRWEASAPDLCLAQAGDPLPTVWPVILEPRAGWEERLLVSGEYQRRRSARLSAHWLWLQHTLLGLPPSALVAGLH